MFSVLILVIWLCKNEGKQGVILPKKTAYQLNATQELRVKGSRTAPFVSKEKAVADAACAVLLTCTCSSLARKLFCLFPNKKRERQLQCFRLPSRTKTKKTLKKNPDLLVAYFSHFPQYRLVIFRNKMVKSIRMKDSK